ncbi:MAG: hypothetical protein HQM16_08335 [Deltaproteobacteria bacterium]|nr:hypothetical protein [Deltaproteobacteria bacterium]
MIQGFLRLLIYLVIGFLVVNLILKYRKKIFTQKTQHFKRVEGDSPPNKLVACPLCGTFFQPSSGVKKNGRIFCTSLCAEKKK